MNRRYLFLFVITILLACTTGKHKIIPKDELVDLLIDLHIHDVIGTNNLLIEQFGGPDSALLYSDVFNKYGYQKEDLEKTIAYYSEKPKKLTEIYDEVFAGLTKMAEELRTVKLKFSSSKNITIWKTSEADTIIGDSGAYPIEYDIEIDTIGTYLITTQIKMTTEDRSINPRISGFLYNPDENDNTKRQPIHDLYITKWKYSKIYQGIIELTDPSFTRLHVTIPEIDGPDSMFFKSLILINLQIIQYQEPSVSELDNI